MPFVAAKGGRLQPERFVLDRFAQVGPKVPEHALPKLVRPFGHVEVVEPVDVVPGDHLGVEASHQVRPAEQERPLAYVGLDRRVRAVVAAGVSGDHHDVEPSFTGAPARHRQVVMAQM